MGGPGSGGKRQPAVLSKLHGNPGHRHIPVEPEAPGELWEAPPDLDEDMRVMWHYVLEHAPRGVLACIDRELVAQYCTATILRARASQEVQRLGLVVKNRDSQAVKNPFLRIMNEQAREARSIGAQLGFSPTARAALGALATGILQPAGLREWSDSEMSLETYLALKPDRLD